MGDISNFPEDLTLMMGEDMLDEGDALPCTVKTGVSNDTVMIEKEKPQNQSNNVENSPFQRCPEAIFTTAVNYPAIEPSQEQIFPSKLEGTKIEEKASKKLKNEWKCGLCGMTATSEYGLDLHLKGRKHKAMEKLLLTTGKNKARAPVEETKMSQEAVIIAGNYEGKEEGGHILAAIKEEIPPSVKCFSSLTKNNEKKRTIEESKVEEKGVDNSLSAGKKPKNAWSCGLCGITAMCEKGLEDHIKGRKHKAKEKSLVGIGKNEGQAPEEEIKFSKAAVSTAGNCTEKEEGELKKNTTSDAKFWCKMCSFGTANEEMMTNHRNGEHHLKLLRKNGGCVVVVKTVLDNLI